MAGERPTCLQLTGIGKRFPGVVALAGVDFDLRQGEIHALLGENGAGKSTLIKVMTGVYTADDGTVDLNGKQYAFKTPQEAVNAGISTVYQEVNLLPNLSIAENICLGREAKGAFGIKWNDVRARAVKALARLDLKLDVKAPLSSLSIALQQMVAIARALDVSAKVLVLDEPTSSLDAHEVEQLFATMRKLREEGLGIIFVTHFLDQVYAVSDRITILRNGQKIGVWNASELPRLELVSQMIGRDAAVLESQGTASLTTETSTPFLTFEGVGRKGAIEGVQLNIGPGQVMGFAGLLGSGRSETVRLIFGADTKDSGNFLLDGRTIQRFNQRKAILSGIGLCPEDRKKEGVFPELSIRENILVVYQAKRGWLRKLSLPKQKQMAGALAKDLGVHPPDIERPIQFLSGGNQQKALLARWMAVEPRLLLLDEPTRGIDVGAKFEIMSLVSKQREEGRSFVFVSSELTEVVRTCQSVLVMRDRKAIKTLTGKEITEDSIIHAIAEDSK